jgi:hypothetical protein
MPLKNEDQFEEPVLRTPFVTPRRRGKKGANIVNVAKTDDLESSATRFGRSQRTSGWRVGDGPPEDCGLEVLKCAEPLALQNSGHADVIMIDSYQRSNGQADPLPSSAGERPIPPPRRTRVRFENPPPVQETKASDVDDDEKIVYNVSNQGTTPNSDLVIVGITADRGMTPTHPRSNHKAFISSTKDDSSESDLVIIGTSTDRRSSSNQRATPHSDFVVVDTLTNQKITPAHARSGHKNPIWSTKDGSSDSEEEAVHDPLGNPALEVKPRDDRSRRKVSVEIDDLVQSMLDRLVLDDFEKVRHLNFSQH